MDYKGNNIITLAVQAHNGELSEPHNSKLNEQKKEQTHKFYLACLLFFSYNMGFGLAVLIYEVEFEVVDGYGVALLDACLA